MEGRNAVLYGMNAYGYEFKLPIVIRDFQARTNELNVNLENFFATSVKLLDKEGNEVLKSYSFKTGRPGQALDDHELYWTKVCYEDGEVLENARTRKLKEAANIKKLNYEYTNDVKFNDELNKHVGKPVMCDAMNFGMKNSGLLLFVAPTKKGSQVAYVDIMTTTSKSLYLMHIDETHSLTVYKDDGKKLKEQTVLGGEPQQMGE